jgi:hypothetical protein
MDRSNRSLNSLLLCAAAVPNRIAHSLAGEGYRMDYDARRFTRVAAECPVRITDRSGDARDAAMINLSIGGIIVACPAPFPEGAACTVRIFVDPATEVEVRGDVIRSTENAMAIAFTTIVSAHFLTMLDLLREYADNPETIDTELHERRHLMPDLE